MKLVAAALGALLLSQPAAAQLAGEPFIHDPSTIAKSDGKYYTFGTGAGGLVSDDGWTWHKGGVRPGGGVAPDIIHIRDRYYVVYAVGGGGMNGGVTGPPDGCTTVSSLVPSRGQNLASSAYVVWQLGQRVLMLRLPEPHVQTRFRPCAFARYSASSASAISSSGAWICVDSTVATPTLTVSAGIGSSPSVACSATRARMRSATFTAPSSPVSGRMTTNSSPP